MGDLALRARHADDTKDASVLETERVDDLFLRTDVTFALHVETFTVSFQVWLPEVPEMTVEPSLTAVNMVV